MRTLTEFEVVKPADKFVRGDAINIGGDVYIVHDATRSIWPVDQVLLILKSLPFPDRDQITMTVDRNTLFVNDTLHNLEL